MKNPTKLGRNAVLGGIDFPQPRSDISLRYQLYLRGLNKTEDPTENELVGPNGEISGRVKNGASKFFPRLLRHPNEPRQRQRC